MLAQQSSPIPMPTKLMETWFMTQLFIHPLRKHLPCPQSFLMVLPKRLFTTQASATKRNTKASPWSHINHIRHLAQSYNIAFSERNIDLSNKKGPSESLTLHISSSGKPGFLLQQLLQVAEGSSAECARLMEQKQPRQLFPETQDKSIWTNPFSNLRRVNHCLADLPETSWHSLTEKETHPECLLHLSVLDTPTLLKKTSS